MVQDEIRSTYLYGRRIIERNLARRRRHRKPIDGRYNSIQRRNDFGSSTRLRLFLSIRFLSADASIDGRRSSTANNRERNRRNEIVRKMELVAKIDRSRRSIRTVSERLRRRHIE